jgi:hypothetical protein
MMKNDVNIKNIRDIRHKISEQQQHDPHKLVKYYIKKQQQHRNRLVKTVKS